MSSKAQEDDSTLPPNSPEMSVPVGDETKLVLRSSPSSKLPKPKIKVPRDAFITVNADTGNHQGRFRILPYSRELNPKYSGAADKLSEFIERGGGVIVKGQYNEERLSPTESQSLIKVLDMEYVRANIQETQDMVLPYDCFSSNFIWNQIYQRSSNNGDVEKRDADLNLFRVSPSAHANYDANGIFQGAVTWNDIQPISSKKLSPALRVKEVALLHFPESIVCSRSDGGMCSKTRRVYSRRESQMLLDKVCEENGHDRVSGVSLYKEIIETYAINRTYRSLKEHFQKTILPHILAGDGYYSITPEDSAKFTKLFDTRRKLQLKRKRSR